MSLMPASMGSRMALLGQEGGAVGAALVAISINCCRPVFNLLGCGMTDFPDIIRSPLSQAFTADGLTVQVEIYRVDGTDGWTLELVDEEGGSTVWQDSFATDTEAFAEFTDGVEQLGLAKLIDPDEDDLATVH